MSMRYQCAFFLQCDAKCGPPLPRCKVWLRSWTASGSKSDSSEDPPCLWTWFTLKLTWIKCPPVGVVLKFGKGVCSVVVLVI
ncbi:hypothetical protein AVEN_24844-1 [Araneus ventricosus]|uniref:Uncharacterized protein n=1 Tax=Araneus ventricosus TaxID=182803 RepID=A0A4Y2BUM9_ARAVE|nr:hypothetical protein AVEN_24844-1 [Araneus ventricosus]